MKGLFRRITSARESVLRAYILLQRESFEMNRFFRTALIALAIVFCGFRLTHVSIAYADDAAQDAADAAQDAADSATQTAQDAGDAADSAQDAADSASQTAQDAQDAADAAQSAADDSE